MLLSGYFSACVSYQNVFHKNMLIKLIITSKVLLSYHDLVNHYEIFVPQMTTDMLGLL